MSIFLTELFQQLPTREEELNIIIDLDNSDKATILTMKHP